MLGKEYRALLLLPSGPCKEPGSSCFQTQGEGKRFHRWKSEAGCRDAFRVHSAELSALSGGSMIWGVGVRCEKEGDGDQVRTEDRGERPWRSVEARQLGGSVHNQ